MARLTTEPKLEARATIQFEESELRALDALIGYGTDPFLKVFYKHMGSSYMKPHEAGLRQLFKTLGGSVGEALRKVDDARKLLNAPPQKPKVRVVG